MTAELLEGLIRLGDVKHLLLKPDAKEVVERYFGNGKMTQSSLRGLELACRHVARLRLLALALLFRCEFNASLPVVPLV